MSDNVKLAASLVVFVIFLCLALWSVWGMKRKPLPYEDGSREVTLDARTMLPPGAIRDHRGRHDFHPEAFFDDGSSRT